MDKIEELITTPLTKPGTVLAYRWKTSVDTIGIVAIKSYNGWKAYIGVGKGYNEEADIQHIKDHGARLMREEAAGFFPQLEPDEYEY